MEGLVPEGGYGGWGGDGNFLAIGDAIMGYGG